MLQKWDRAKRQISRTPLSLSVLLSIISGIALAVGGMWFIGALVGVREGEQAQPIEVLKTALTVVAGVGGAVALVVAYRRQRDLEQSRFVDRFVAAATQLGNPDPAVRIAGAYAMAGAADDTREAANRQQCIDVLCGYLRLPYDPKHGESHISEIVTTTKSSSPPSSKGAGAVEEAARRSIRTNDKEVRRTIFGIIRDHVTTGAGSSWSRHTFNFERTVIEDMMFESLHFEGPVSFKGAIFSGSLMRFNDTEFGSLCDFKEAIFDCSTYFFNVKFTGASVEFHKAQFKRHVSFASSYFENQDYTLFGTAMFEGGKPTFHSAQFSAPRTSFNHTKFLHGADFQQVYFGGKEVSFGGALFHSDTDFSNAVFESAKIDFSGPQAWNSVEFDWKSNPAGKPTTVLPRQWPPRVRDYTEVKRRSLQESGGEVGPSTPKQTETD